MALKLNPENPLATKVQTRDGRPARIVNIDAKGKRPITALVDLGGCESAINCETNGKFWDDIEHGLDLVNVPEKRVAWVNAYPSEAHSVYSTRELADAIAGPTRIACVRVEYTEGQFDD